MIKKNDFKKLAIRVAVLIRPDYGFIYAADLIKERKSIPHTNIFSWDSGKVKEGRINYNAHSACLIRFPEQGVVDVSESGYYTVNSGSGTFIGNLFNNSSSSIPSLSGGIRSVSEINGIAHVVGEEGIVFKLEDVNKWKYIGNGLLKTFDVEAIHGFNESDVYAVGNRGQVWHYNGEKWKNIKVPTSKNLLAIKCVPDGSVYVAGRDGLLLKGKLGKWKEIELSITDNIWGIEWFNDALWISTFTNVYQLKNHDLIPANFGKVKPSCYKLIAIESQMWSVGEFDIMSFDGKKWEKLIDYDFK